MNNKTPRFRLIVDTAGGFWTACTSNDWLIILQETEKWNGRMMTVFDRAVGLSYDFHTDIWVKTGTSIPQTTPVYGLSL